jgi:hypothetical protein
VGLLDWIKEVNEQTYEDERKQARKKHKNDPEKLDRALRRIDARAKPSNTVLAPEPPDITGMDEDELQTLHDQTEIEIEELENMLAYSKGLIDDHKPKKPGGLLDQIGKSMFLVSEVAAREQIREKKKLVAAIKVKLRKPASKMLLAPKPSKGVQLAAELNAIEQEEQQVLATVSPQMKAHIEKLYRQKRDEILDKYR